MPSYLLDTNHASALWRRPELLRPRMAIDPDLDLGLCVPSVGELWYMVHASARAASNAAELHLFVGGFYVWRYDRAEAEEFGKIKAELRILGRPIPDVDSQIAAVARRHGLTLLTADGHFRHVGGLNTENWLP